MTQPALAELSLREVYDSTRVPVQTNWARNALLVMPFGSDR